MRPAILLKKKLCHRCFPVSFVKFLRTPILQNTSRRLQLSKTHSHDKMSVRVLKMFKNCISRPLVLILSDCLKNNVFLIIQMKGSIVPIHKNLTNQTLETSAQFPVFHIWGNLRQFSIYKCLIFLFTIMNLIKSIWFHTW